LNFQLIENQASSIQNPASSIPFARWPVHPFARSPVCRFPDTWHLTPDILNLGRQPLAYIQHPVSSQPVCPLARSPVGPLALHGY